MKFLDNLRDKPLAYRKKVVWIAAIAFVILIFLVSLVFLKEWSIPKLEVGENKDIQKLVDNSKTVARDMQTAIDNYDEIQEDMEISGEEKLATEYDLPVKIKKDVSVSLLSWERQGSFGIAQLGIENFSDQDANLSSIYLYQGTEGIASTREITIAAGQQKEVEVSFPISSETVTGIEIQKATNTNLEASASVNLSEEWSYLLRIENDVTPPAPEEESPQPEESIVELPIE